MNEVVVDTHAILWYLYLPDRLSPAATAALNLASSSMIYLSAVSLVEVAYLIDKGRLPDIVLDQLTQATEDPASGIVLAPVTPDVAQALKRVPRKLVPDMPDRIIVATAVQLGLPLVTADTQIQSSGIATIW
jgi:PIN domain nuclease of toxin-antitoxin system